MTEEIQRTGRGCDLCTPELLDKVREYMEVWPTIPMRSGRPRIVPSVDSLAKYIGIGRQTIYDWQKRDDRQEFNALVDQILSDQKDELVNGGLSKELDSKTVALMLSRHGVILEKAVDHKSTDGSMSPKDISDEELDRRIDAILKK